VAARRVTCVQRSSDAGPANRGVGAWQVLCPIAKADALRRPPIHLVDPPASRASPSTTPAGY